MLNLISAISYWIFLNIITIECSLKVAFQNGASYIRCSDDRILFYHRNLIDEIGFRTFLSCSGKYSFSTDFYAGLTWKKFKIHCNTDPNTINEIIKINKHLDMGSSRKISLETVVHEIVNSHKIYSYVISEDDDYIKLELTDMPINEVISENEQSEVYIRFLDQSMLCRILFDIIEPCPTNENLVDNPIFECYYDLSSKQDPSIEFMKAEIKQVLDNIPRPLPETQIISIKKPVVNNKHFESDSQGSTSSPNSKKNVNNHNKNKPSSINEPNNSKQQSNSFGSIIFIIISLIIIAIISVIIFFLIKKKQSNQSTVQSEPLENIASNTSSSSQSIHSIEDKIKAKSNIVTQKPDLNKRQRPGTTLNFNEDG